MDKEKLHEIELNDKELEQVNGGFELTREQYESGGYCLYGNKYITFEGDTYELVTGYESVPLFYAYKQVGGTKQLLIPLDKL